jgi:hypothetical protein
MKRFIDLIFLSFIIILSLLLANYNHLFFIDYIYLLRITLGSIFLISIFYFTVFSDTKSRIIQGLFIAGLIGNFFYLPFWQIGILKFLLELSIGILPVFIMLDKNFKIKPKFDKVLLIITSASHFLYFVFHSSNKSLFKDISFYWGMHIKHLDKSIKFGAYEYTPESD